MGCPPFLRNSRLPKALLARALFAIHGIITIWRVTDVYSEMIYYLLVIPVCLLPLEMVLTLKFTDNGEWKWFCPSVLLYLASVVPGLWLLQFDLYDKRIAYRDSMGWTQCSADTVYNSSNISSTIGGFQISLSLSDDSWTMALEQFLLSLLIVGRWLLPRGCLTRDQLSQLLLAYIGMAADILEFSLESLNEQAVMCNRVLITIILGAWNWSLLQFTLVLTSASPSPPQQRAGTNGKGKPVTGYLRCSENEIWVLCITIVMQDGPLLAMRLYLLIQYRVMNQMMLFFVIKNVLVILLQLYRIGIICCGGDEGYDGLEKGTNSATPRGKISQKETVLKKTNGSYPSAHYKHVYSKPRTGKMSNSHV